MRAGLLQYRIQVTTPHVEKNGYGEEECRYIPKFSARARVVYDDGGRVLENNEVWFDARVTFTIRMHFFNRLDEFDRIVFEGRQYRIVSPPELQRALQCVVIRTELINE